MEMIFPLSGTLPPGLSILKPDLPPASEVAQARGEAVSGIADASAQ